MPAPFTGAQATPLLGQFLVSINGFVETGNGTELASYVALEPPFNDTYARMISELRSVFPRTVTSAGGVGSDDALEERCKKSLSFAERESWRAFTKFMAQYLAFIRDVDMDPAKYLDTYNALSELQGKANSALAHPSLGSLMLPIVVRCAKLLCRLAIGLDKHPELLSHHKMNTQGGGDDDGGPRETLPERAANILRQAFVTCLNDRASVFKDGKPQGKKQGIYTIANLCLKILFQCRKTRNATQIFENIYNLSPSLDAYPKSERVAYLYYLGRFLFQNSHFYRAQLALQYAYNLSPAVPAFVRQRRQILVFLVASNITMGRFPSSQLLQRPEAQGFAEHFTPLLQSIRRGDLPSFKAHLAPDSPHAAWFQHFRILLQLRNRCEVLLWRSLVRKTWILNGTRPNPNVRAGPLVNIQDLVTALTVMEHRNMHAAKTSGNSSEDPTYVDPDFEGVDDIDAEEDEQFALPSARAVESILSSLVDQGLLHGFIAHRQEKFVISGVKAKGGDTLAAGFPRPWDVISQRADEEVPGWKQRTSGTSDGFSPGPGMVIKLGNLRPVGSG